MAVPTSGLNALGQIFERKFIRAWELFQMERFEEANEISRMLVADDRVGDLHRAGCHLILAHSPDDYVHHAEQALQLFEGLYADPRFPPDEEQKKLQEDLIATAERVLMQARADAEIFAESSHNYSPHALKRLSTDGVRSILAARRHTTDMFLSFPSR